MAKSNKDPNKPKGRMSAYNYFIKDEREVMKKTEEGLNDQEKSPQITLQAFSRACAEKWKTLSVDEKQRFQEAAEKDKIRFDKEMASYTPPKSETSGRKTRKAKKAKDPHQPKRNMSAFMFFSNESRSKVKEENPQAPVTEISKMLGVMWSKMEVQEKEKYQKLAKEDRERYDEEMKAFKKGDYVLPSTTVAEVVSMEAEE